MKGPVIIITKVDPLKPTKLTYSNDWLMGLMGMSQ